MYVSSWPSPASDDEAQTKAIPIYLHGKTGAHTSQGQSTSTEDLSGRHHSTRCAALSSDASTSDAGTASATSSARRPIKAGQHAHTRASSAHASTRRHVSVHSSAKSKSNAIMRLPSPPKRSERAVSETHPLLPAMFVRKRGVFMRTAVCDVPFMGLWLHAHYRRWRRLLRRTAEDFRRLSALRRAVRSAMRGGRGRTEEEGRGEEEGGEEEKVEESGEERRGGVGGRREEWGGEERIVEGRGEEWGGEERREEGRGEGEGRRESQTCLSSCISYEVFSFLLAMAGPLTRVVVLRCALSGGFAGQCVAPSPIGRLRCSETRGDGRHQIGRAHV